MLKFNKPFENFQLVRSSQTGQGRTAKFLKMIQPDRSELVHFYQFGEL